MDDCVKKILYVGCGIDDLPLIDFKKVEEFIFVDVAPRCLEKNKISVNDWFICELERNYSKANFFMDSCEIIEPSYIMNNATFMQMVSLCCNPIPKIVNPTLVKYRNYNTKQVIKYYMSTDFPKNVNDELIKDISQCDGLIIGKHIPSIELLDMMSKNEKPKYLFFYFKKCFIGNYFSHLDYDTILGYFSSKENTKYFNQFILINDDDGHFVRTNEYNKMLDFVKNKLIIHF